MPHSPTTGRTRHTHSVGVRSTHGFNGYEPAITSSEEVFHQDAIDQVVGQQNLMPGAVSAGAIAAGAIDVAAFAAGIRPIILVTALPTLPDVLYPVNTFVYKTNDVPPRLYKNVADVWVAAIGPDDIQANSITAGQIAAGAVSTSELAVGARLTGEVANEVGGSPGVFIDSSGILIRDGKLTLLDAFGASALYAGGFAGSWLNFLANGGIYNGDFTYGDTTDIPVTEVGSGSNTANYLASITNYLPYWVVSASGSDMKRVTDAEFPGGSALQMTSVGLGSKTTRIYQDIPVAALTPIYSFLQVSKTVAVWHGTVTLNTYGSWRAADHSILGTRTLCSTDVIDSATRTFPVTGVAATDLLTHAGHGLAVDQPIVFTTLSGGAGLSVDTIYYVIASGLTANDFKISATLGGGAFNFTTDLTAGSNYNDQQQTGTAFWLSGNVEDLYNLDESDIASYVRLELEIVQSTGGQIMRFGRLELYKSITTAYMDTLDGYATNMSVTTDRGGVNVFPVSPQVGDRCWKFDLHMEFEWDGTNWLCTCPHTSQPEIHNTSTPMAVSASTNAVRRGGSIPVIGSDIWLTKLYLTYNVGPGTALSGSHSWTITHLKYDTALASTTIGTTTINSGASGSSGAGVFRTNTITINAALGATYLAFGSNVTKVGTPGNLQYYEFYEYRHIAT